MKKSLGAKVIVFPTPIFAVGSYDKEGKPNVMIAAWGGICCSEPPCVAVSIRKARHSYQSILERRAFTISIPSEQHVEQADYLGLVSGSRVDKFAATGLTPARSELVDAPFVAEFPLVVECTLRQTIELGVHTQFIGEVVDVKADEAVLDADGLPDAEKVRPFWFAPETCNYYGTGQLIGKAFSIGKSLESGSG